MTTGNGSPIPPADPITAATVFDEGAALDGVVETLVDGVRGYRTAASTVADAELAGVLRELANKRRIAVENLVRVAADQGATISAELDGTAAGGVHRAWIEIEGTVAGDGSILKSAKNGEEHALEECEELLRAGIGEPIAGAVREAAADIREAIATLDKHID